MLCLTWNVTRWPAQLLCVCVFGYVVKAFLAQAKDEFNKKWDEPAQVCINPLTPTVAIWVQL